MTIYAKSAYKTTLYSFKNILKHLKMAFKKGNKLGPGRPKGLRNKKTLEAKARVEKVLSMIDETLEEDIAELTASERMKTYVALLEYQLPKLQRVALANDTNDDGEKLSFEVIMNRSQIDEEKTS